MDLYSSILKKADENPEKNALIYFNRTTSYGKLANNIKQYSSILYDMGVRAGDIVTVSLPTTPESIAITYALNKIGATINFMDVRSTAKQVSKIVRLTNSKLLFIMNLNTKAIARRARRMNVERIVVLRGVESLPIYVRLWYTLGDYLNGRHKHFHSDKRFVFWSDIVKRESSTKVPVYEWPANAPQLIFPTSGTSGNVKSAILTAENINNAALCFPEIARNLNPCDTVLGTIPIFTMTGFETSVHFPLLFGNSVVIIPIWKVANFMRITNKYKPQHIWSVPSYWDCIYSKKNKAINLSFLKTAIVFGDIIKPDFERSINAFLKEHGHNFIIKKIYGMTETAGIVTMTDDSDEYNYINGYSGAVKANHKVKIEDGEICVHTATKVLGYYADPEATTALLRQHDDGLIWLHTGDFGHLDKNGNLYVEGRKKRMIVRYDGSKIFPIEIEATLTKHPDIKDCTVVGVPDDDHLQSFLPVAFITLTQNSNKNTLTEIRKYATKELPKHLQPHKIIIIKNLPLTKVGKTDYKKLIEYIK